RVERVFGEAIEDAVDKKLAKADRAAWARGVRMVNGQPFPLGSPRPTSLENHGPDSRAPGHIHSRGQSETYSFAKALRSVFERDRSLAPLEWDFSQKLEGLGYHGSVPGAMQIPLGMDVWTAPGKEPEAENLNAEIKGLYPVIAIDPDEVR